MITNIREEILQKNRESSCIIFGILFMGMSVNKHVNLMINNNIQLFIFCVLGFVVGWLFYKIVKNKPEPLYLIFIILFALLTGIVYKI